MTKTYWLLVILSIAQVSYGQQNRLLSVGDTLHRVRLTMLESGRIHEVNFSELKEQVLILDFWFTGCKPCIASFPKLIEYQKKYGDQIKIILINPLESMESVIEFINGRFKPGQLNLAFVSEVTLSEKLGIHGYPTTVILDKYRVIKRIETTFEETHIDRYIKD